MSSVLEIRDYVCILHSEYHFFKQRIKMFKNITFFLQQVKEMPYKSTLEYKEVVLSSMLLYFRIKIQPLNQTCDLHE